MKNHETNLKKHGNQRKTMKNHETNLKNHGNQPKTMKNQETNLKNHGSDHFLLQTDKQTLHHNISIIIIINHNRHLTDFLEHEKN